MTRQTLGVGHGMGEVADAIGMRADECSAACAPTTSMWRQLEDGLWAFSERPGSLRVIERCGDAEYIVHSGHRSQLGRFPSLSVAMSAAAAGVPAAVA
jgi:hypothetical protein